MMMNEVVDEAQRRKGRRELIGLMIVFALPIVIAAILYNNLDRVPIKSFKNFGDLVVPARPLEDVPLQKRNGEQFQFSEMRRKWVLVYIGNAECDETCAANLYKMRQSRLGQGGELKRIKRLYILKDGQPGSSLLKILEDHPGLEVITGNKPVIDKVLQQFNVQEQTNSQAPAMYIVDPLGNLMMSYPEGFDAKGLAKDLSLLLKASQIG